MVRDPTRIDHDRGDAAYEQWHDADADQRERQDSQESQDVARSPAHRVALPHCGYWPLTLPFGYSRLEVPQESVNQDRQSDRRETGRDGQHHRDDAENVPGLLRHWITIGLRFFGRGLPVASICS